MGDGSISKRKDARYDCVLSFALREKNFVDAVRDIVKQLFGYDPKVVVNHSWYTIVMRRSIARYLHEQCGYPTGKKSVGNPNIPDWIMRADSFVKIAFVRGFLNAEASIDDCVKIPQSVRIFPPEHVQDKLKRASNFHDAASFKYYSLRGNKAKYILGKRYLRQSNILLDLQKLLYEFQISSKINLNRVWMSPRSNCVSLHYELYIPKRMIKHLKRFNMLTKENK